MINFSAADKTSGRKHNVTVQVDSGLTNAELGKMGIEVDDMRERQERRRFLVNAQSDAETLLYSVEKQMLELQPSIIEAQEMEKLVADLREALTGEDCDKIQALRKQLQDLSWQVTGATNTAKTRGDQAEEPKPLALLSSLHSRAQALRAEAELLDDAVSRPQAAFKTDDFEQIQTNAEELEDILLRLQEVCTSPGGSWLRPPTPCSTRSRNNW
mmetsp:Transcript_4832/g.11811  ORF Transcript_4832/g.11811 Transcript_4832/m.11811 type:complete len:214 (-) Transcript_4832:691-1332(-)